jgi:hypothetical protein
MQAGRHNGCEQQKQHDAKSPQSRFGYSETPDG